MFLTTSEDDACLRIVPDAIPRRRYDFQGCDPASGLGQMVVKKNKHEPWVKQMGSICQK